MAGPRLFSLLTALLLVIPATPAAAAGPTKDSCLRTIPVSGNSAFSAALAAAKPGDCLSLADGVYSAVTAKNSGSAANPIVISAKNRLKAGFTSGTVAVTGSHVTFEGFTFTGSANFRMTDTVGSRVTRSVFRSSAKEFVQLYGKNGDGNRVDHNEMGPKKQEGHFVQIGQNPYTPTTTLVDHNYFHDLAAGDQGGEALRVGGFGPPGDYFKSHTVFEYNLLVHCDGDAEILSLKGSANTFRYNTVRASSGTINIRAGVDNVIQGNFVFGDGNKKAQGIRLSEDNHLIYDNYVEVVDNPLILNAGDPKPGNPPPGVPPTGEFKGHAQVRNAVVAGNTFIGASSGVDFGGGSAPPLNLTFSGNLVRSGGTNVGHGSTPTKSTYAANLLFGGTPGISGPGFRVADPKLVRVAGVFQPGPDSPALRAGVSTPILTEDVEGRQRLSPPDIGAVEASSTAAATRLPLTTADVGPSAP
ncbi:Chondroitinase B [Amycolatopsis xylanica]|uniref:Chondroitinase B n=1 Tax=Amycolatopsis xylanica TaxID=589385 RepID=A0A1H3G2Z6_9PSEU|nr:polysaccharide lyase 6 family protein [Amycolatopsis xylanica]SDX97465.1 Chondroitinase B [Amycolatopsis xylanica]